MDGLHVNEIFYSIQGESSFSGKPCVFVRLTFCNLRCTYCDTEYAFYDGTKMSVDEILTDVSKYGCNLVELTGGEPLMQEEVHELMKILCDRGYQVLLETGGSLDIGRVDSRVRRIVDLKCPSSNMVKHNLWTNIAHLRGSDEVKFVIGSREDYEWSIDVIRRYDLESKCQVLLSPVFGAIDPARLAEWVLESKMNIRFQLQLHKLIWAADMRGV